MKAFAVLGLAIAGVAATTAIVGTSGCAPGRTELAPDIDVCSTAHIEWLLLQRAWLDTRIDAYNRPFEPGSRYRLASPYDEERTRVAVTLRQCLAGPDEGE